MSAFPVKSFRQALQDTKSLQSKLSKYFIVECKKHNMIWIDGITQEFYRIFSSKENLKLKVNAMYAIQYFVQLAEYPIQTLFQVYILPIILEIALFKTPQQTYENTSQYFLSQGYPASTPNIKQLSHNYITLSHDFIFNCASIKPYRTFESNQMNQPSQYKKAALKLNKMGVNQRDFNTQIQNRIQISRQDFLKNLSKFDNDSQYYVSYYMKKVQQYIIEGVKYKQTLDFKRIMKYGDVFLTSEAIGHCCQALQNQNFYFKKNSLLLIHDFVVWGDIQAIMMINYAEYIEQIFDRISQVKGELSINAGQQIYPQIIGQRQAKKGFYLEFLKCLQTWAMAIPKTNFDGTKSATQQDQQFSPVFLLYIKLKNQRQFKFPENAILPKQKKQLEQSLVINKQRNNLIMRQLQQNAEDTLSLSKKSIKPINKFEKYRSKNSVIKQQRQSQFVTTSEIQKYIKSAQQMLEDLLQKIQNNSMNDAQNILQKLNDFCTHFESKLQIIDDSIDEQNLQNLYKKGIDRIDRINCISDYFQDYKDEKINIMKLQQLIRYQINKALSQDVSSRYMDDYRSRKSKKSMSKSFGNQSHHLRQSKQKSIQLRNFSHDKFKIPIDHSNHQININQKNKIQKDNQSQVSRSTERGGNKKQSFRKNSQNEDEQNESNGSYDFGNQNYGFQDVQKQKSQTNQNHSKRSINSSKISHQSSLHKPQRNQGRQSKRSSNIYTNQKQIVNNNNSKVSFSDSQNSISNKRKSIHEEQIPSQKQSQNKKSNTSKKQSDKKQNITNGKISNSQSNFTKSKKLTENSQSFMIASGNLKKLNQISNTPSSQQIHQNHSVHQKEYNFEKLPLNRSQHLNHNPHKVLTSADPKQLQSFNMTNIIGFSKAPPSSVNKISSIQQRKFKFQMLNSQDRQMFDDESSKDQPNEDHKRLKQEVHQDQNPGFGIVFKNKSNLKNSKADPYSKITRNIESHDELRSNLSPSRSASRQNSKLKQSKRVTQTKTVQQQKSPLTQRQYSSKLVKSKQQVNQRQSSRGNIYTIPTSPKRQGFNRFEKNRDSNLDKSNSSKKSLRRSERSSQRQHTSERNSQINLNPSIRKSQQNSEINPNQGYSRPQRNSQINVSPLQKMNLFKAKEQFNQSSFAQSSQDTPKILQRSKNYYNDEDQEQIPRQKQSIYLQKNTSPKHQKISFANSSKQNILSSKLVISQKDQKQQYDKSNLTPSEVPKSRLGSDQRFQKQSSALSKEKIKSIISGQGSKLKSSVQHPSSELKRKIDSQKKIQYLANKQLEDIKLLRQRLQKVENDSRYLMQFQRSNIKSPDIPRYAVTPRSPRFRDQNSSLSIEARQRISFINNSGYMSPQTKPNFDLNSSFSRQYLITPEGKLIKKKNYERYFNQLKSSQSLGIKNTKKHLLKNKQLIHKNDNIQIGVTILRQRNRLKIIYFITPQKPIEKFIIEIQPSRKLKIKYSQNQFTDLQTKKQYKIYTSCEIIQFPYILPRVQFTYKNDKKTFYLGQGSAAIVPETKVQLFLPISQISSPEVSQLTSGKQVYRTQEFPLNPKIIKKPHEINDYIPNLSILSQSGTLTIYCGRGAFFGYNFVFKINFKMNHFVYVQGICIDSPQKSKLSQNIVEWFLVCMQQLFIKQIMLEQRDYR